MKYLLDANTIIGLVSFPETMQLDRFAACDEDDIVTSSIAFAEVAFGSAMGQPLDRDELTAFVDEVPILQFDAAAAEAYASLPFRRGSFDRLIAAHALALGLVLVTDDPGDFHDVPALAVENWMLPLP